MSISIGWPEAIYLLINIAGLCVVVKDGERAATPILTWFFVTLPLLYWGGFFS